MPWILLDPGDKQKRQCLCYYGTMLGKGQQTNTEIYNVSPGIDKYHDAKQMRIMRWEEWVGSNGWEVG